MNENQRVKKVIEVLKQGKYIRNQQDFAERIGADKSTISQVVNGKISVPNNLFGKISKAFPQFNIEWLLNDKGEMLNGTAPQLSLASAQPIKSYTRGVPYYNVDFLGGFDLIFNDSTIIPEYLIDFRDFNRATCWCNITGHSMEPEINHGDIIALREISDFSFIPYGEIYAIVTTSGMRTIKRIGPSSDPNCYALIPTNKSPEYGVQEIPRTSIMRLFEVLGCMKKI